MDIKEQLVSLALNQLQFTALQHPAALCRSAFLYYFLRLCTNSVDVDPYLLFIVTYNTCFCLIGHLQMYKLCA
jgi:hypothetical protein